MILVAIPISVWIIYRGELYFGIVVLLLSSITLWEYYKLLEKKGAKPLIALGLVSHVLLLAAIYINLKVNFRAEILLGILSMAAVFSSGILIWTKRESAALSFASTLSGLLYVTVAFVFLIVLREISNYTAISNHFFRLSNTTNLGGGLVVTIFLSVWICDTAAYLSGMAFGRHKLIPSVSPKKTWEGAIGGFIGAVLAFFIFASFLMPTFNYIHAIICGIIVGTIGQIGDLAESKLKRDAEIKDSSHIIPGHGGMLDRFDSILFAVPAVAVYMFVTYTVSELLSVLP